LRTNGVLKRSQVVEHPWDDDFWNFQN
jgi:hypothetical protein